MPEQITDESYLVELGNRVRSARKSLGWTQEDLADASGLDRSYIGGIERGERNISFLSLCLIARSLRIDIASITKDIPRVDHG
jgi:transcriptional regulator with XRE-family HTH domain